MAGSLTGHRKYGEAASCYIENSVEENACTKELQELHKMVKAAKQDREIVLAYMKSFEIA